MSISCFCAKAHLLFHIGVSIIDRGFINWQLFGGRGWHRCDILPLLFGYYLHSNFRQFHVNFMNIIRLCSDLSNLPMIDVSTFWIFLSDKFLAFKTPLGPRYDDEIPEANRFQLPMLFAYLQSLKVWVCLVLSERHGSDSQGLNFRLIPTGLLFLVLDCGFFSIIGCKDYCYNNSCFMGY